jgi:hypothetical protein
LPGCVLPGAAFFGLGFFGGVFFGVGFAVGFGLAFFGGVFFGVGFLVAVGFLGVTFLEALVFDDDAAFFADVPAVVTVRCVLSDAITCAFCVINCLLPCCAPICVDGARTAVVAGA